MKRKLLFCCIMVISRTITPNHLAYEYFHLKGALRAKSEEVQRWLKQLTLTEYLKIYLFDRDRPLGTYFDYVGYMWRAAKNNPNSLIVYYEDVVRVSTQV